MDTRFFSTRTKNLIESGTKKAAPTPTTTQKVPLFAEAVASLPPIPLFGVTWKLPTPQDYALMCALSAYSPKPHGDETRWQKAVFSALPTISQFIQDWKDEGWYRYCIFLPSVSEEAPLGLHTSVFINDLTRQIVVAFNGNEHTDFSILGVKKLLTAVEKELPKMLKSISHLLEGNISDENGLFSVLDAHGRTIGGMPSDYQLSFTGYGIGGWFALAAANLYCPPKPGIATTDLYRSCKPVIVTFDVPGDKNLFEDLRWSAPPNYTSYVGPPTFLNTLTPHQKLETLHFIGLGEDSTKPDAYSTSSLQEILSALLEVDPNLTLIYSPTSASSASILSPGSVSSSTSLILKEQRGQIYRVQRWPSISWPIVYDRIPNALARLGSTASMEGAILGITTAIIGIPEISGAVMVFFLPTAISLSMKSYDIYLQYNRLSEIQKGGGRAPNSSSRTKALMLNFDYSVIPNNEMAYAIIPPAIKLFLQFLKESNPQLPNEYSFLKKVSVSLLKNRDWLNMTGATSARDVVDAAGKLLFACYQEQLSQLPLWKNFTEWLEKTAEHDGDAQDLQTVISESLSRRKTTTTRSATPEHWEIAASSSKTKALNSVEESMLTAAKANQWEWASLLMGPSLKIVPRTRHLWHTYFSLLQERDYQHVVATVLNHALAQTVLPEDPEIITKVQFALKEKNKEYSPPSITKAPSTQGEYAVITQYKFKKDGVRIFSKIPKRKLRAIPLDKSLVQPENQFLKPENANTLHEEYVENFIIQKVDPLISVLQNISSKTPAERRTLLQKEYDNCKAAYDKLNGELSSLKKTIEHETNQGWEQYARIVKTHFTHWIRAHANNSTPQIPIPEELLPVLEAIARRCGDHENQKISALWEWFNPQVLKTNLYANTITSPTGSPSTINALFHRAIEEGKWEIAILLATADVNLGFPNGMKNTALYYIRQHLEKTQISGQKTTDWILDRVQNHFEEVPSWLNLLAQSRRQSLIYPLYPEQTWWQENYGTQDEQLAAYISLKLESYLESVAVKKELTPRDLMWREQALQMLQVLDYYWIVGLNTEDLLHTLNQLLDHNIFQPILGTPPETLSSNKLSYWKRLFKLIASPENRKEGEKKLQERYTVNIKRNFGEIQDLKEENARLTLNNIEQNHLLAEKDTQLAEQKTQLTEQKTQLTEQKTQLAEQKTQLAEKDTQLAEKDTRLAEKDTQLAESQRENIEMKEIIAKEKFKTAALQQKCEELRRENQTLLAAPRPEESQRWFPGFFGGH